MRVQPALWVFGACYVPAFLQARGWHVPRAAANADTRAAPCIPVKTLLGGPESQYHHYQTSTSNPFRASLFGHHRRPSTTLFSLLVQLLLAFPPFYCLSSAARLTPALNPNHHRARFRRAHSSHLRPSALPRLIVLSPPTATTRYPTAHRSALRQTFSSKHPMRCPRPLPLLCL